MTKREKEKEKQQEKENKVIEGVKHCMRHSSKPPGEERGILKLWGVNATKL